MSYRILIVDDESDICELVADILRDEGFDAHTVITSNDALLAVAQNRFHLVFLDIWLQGSEDDGLVVLDKIRHLHPELPVVMISGHGTIETAISAIRRGAYDFIEKPFTADRLLLVTERALENSRLKQELQTLRAQPEDSDTLIGNSAAMNALHQAILKVAGTNSRVLISGESGSGKELVAREIHANSPRSTERFVALNAASITPQDMEAALFGSVAKGNTPYRPGALEEANGGTLLLDNIADMPYDTQGKILDVLNTRFLEHSGGMGRVAMDVRIISTTSRDLQHPVANGKFRPDLYYRLNVVPLHVPSLAERREDIPELIAYFTERIAQTTGLTQRPVSAEVIASLQASDWPGNVRQLRNNVERLMILAEKTNGTGITTDFLPGQNATSALSFENSAFVASLINMPMRDARDVFEKVYLQAQIRRFSGNVSRTAEFIGMERSTLHRKMKNLNI